MIITLKNCDEIVGFAMNNGFEVEEYQGTLLDNYIIHADKKLRVGGKTAEYIVIKVEHLNEWSSQLRLCYINCEKRISNLRKKMC